MTSPVYAETIKGGPIAKAVYMDYLPAALENRTFLPMPKEIVGTGLEAVEVAMTKMRKGVSGVKLVVKL